MLTGVIVAGGATSALATTSQTQFSGVMNRFQQSRYFEYQNKSKSNTDSKINFSYIGGGYLANVKAQNGASGTEYTERKGLTTGITYNITNKTPAGTSTRLIVTNNSNVPVDVSISGYFITE